MIAEGDGCWRSQIPATPPELGDILAYTAASHPLVAMTRRAVSSLADAADIALVVPQSAKPAVGLAPTTSTTMMLALGDAIAVALLEPRLLHRDFQALHPGGQLGRQLLRVADVMHAGEQCAGRRRQPDVGRDPGDDRQELRLRRRGGRPWQACRHRHRRRSPPPHGSALLASASTSDDATRRRSGRRRWPPKRWAD